MDFTKLDIMIIQELCRSQIHAIDLTVKAGDADYDLAKKAIGAISEILGKIEGHLFETVGVMQ